MSLPFVLNHGVVTRQPKLEVCLCSNLPRPALSFRSVADDVQVVHPLYGNPQLRRCSAITRAEVNRKAAEMREDYVRPAGASRRPTTSALDPAVYDNISGACSSGLPDVEACTLDFQEGANDSDYIARSAHFPQKQKQSPVSSDPDHIISEAWTRGRWLLGLLVLQSASSVVLDRYEVLLREHLVVTLFLTMLVGAGGNAGNQSAIKVIRGLATGKLNSSLPSIRRSVWQQARVGLVLGTVLSLGGFLRVYLSDGSLVNASAIATALFAIVMTSVVLGSALPFCLSRAGIDPANAGTSIQVVMDIFGVAITCATCDFVFHQLMTGL